MRYKLLYAMLIVAVQLSFCNFMDKDVFNGKLRKGYNYE